MTWLLELAFRTQGVDVRTYHSALTAGTGSWPASDKRIFRNRNDSISCSHQHCEIFLFKSIILEGTAS